MIRFAKKLCVWVNHRARAYARVSPETVDAEIARMENRPALKVIRCYGSKRLLLSLQRRGMTFPVENSGICNLCGQMLERASLEELNEAAENVLRTATTAPL